MVKLLKKKKVEKKVENIGKNVVLETPEIIEDPRKDGKELSGSAKIAQKLNDLMR